jgi:hypothetical protein
MLTDEEKLLLQATDLEPVREFIQNALKTKSNVCPVSLTVS